MSEVKKMEMNSEKKKIRVPQWKTPKISVITVLKAFQCKTELGDYGWINLDTEEPIQTLEAVEWYEIREFTGIDLEEWYRWIPRTLKDQLRDESILIPRNGEDFSGVHIDISEMSHEIRTILRESWKAYWLHLHEQAAAEASKEYATWEVQSDTGARCLWRKQSVRSILMRRDRFGWGRVIIDEGRLAFTGKMPWKPITYSNYMRRKTNLQPAMVWEAALKPPPLPQKNTRGADLDAWRPIVGDPTEMYWHLSHHSMSMMRRSYEWMCAFYESVAMLRRLLELV